MIRLFLLSLIVTLTTGVALAPAADHDHDHDHGEHEDHGPTQPLGTITVGEVTLTLGLAGDPKPGNEVHLEIATEPTTAAFTAIRTWIGIESGRGSEKARAEAETGEGHAGHWSAHIAVPDPLPEGSQVWIQTQQGDAAAVVHSVALTPGDAEETDHEHDEPADHEHTEEKPATEDGDHKPH